MSNKLILDLCGGTGSWSEPYRRAGYRVLIIDPYKDTGTVEAFQLDSLSPHGILAAPPCTEFAVSGARWWKDKRGKLAPALRTVHACLRIIRQAQQRSLQWWALENPVGRLPKFIGPYRYTFQPWEFGDPWWKRTCIWGQHREPRRSCAEAPPRIGERWRQSLTNHLSPTPTADQIAKLVKTGMLPPDWIHRLGPSPLRATLRSLTPPSFARAFFERNP